MHHSSWFVTVALVGINVTLVQQVASAKSAEEVGSIATAITVEIKLIKNDNGVNNPDSGSGIILQREQDVYTLLTAGHVVKNSISLTIKTADGTIYKPIPNSIRESDKGLDLAVLKFRSQKSYNIVKIGTSQSLKIGSVVYVAGFPETNNDNVIRSGTLSFLDGRVTGILAQGNPDGYSLIYGNQTLPGMSGGPVLNENGELVAIHGQGERERDTRQKTGRNLGIVVERLNTVALGLKLDQPVVAFATNLAANAADYYLAGIDKVYELDYEGALTDFNRAVSLDPKYVEAYVFRGGTRTQLNDVDGAKADLNKALSLDPKSALAYTFRGVLKSQKLNDFKGALADTNRAIALDPKLSLAYLSRASLVGNNNRSRGIYTDSKQIELELADTNRSIALDPYFAQGYIYRSFITTDRVSKIKDLQKAAKLLRKQGHFRALSDVIGYLQEQRATEEP